MISFFSLLLSLFLIVASILQYGDLTDSQQALTVGPHFIGDGINNHSCENVTPRHEGDMVFHSCPSQFLSLYPSLTYFKRVTGKPQEDQSNLTRLWICWQPPEIFRSLAKLSFSTNLLMTVVSRQALAIQAAGMYCDRWARGEAKY
jgi:hypothetical protein